MEGFIELLPAKYGIILTQDTNRDDDTSHNGRLVFDLLMNPISWREVKKVMYISRNLGSKIPYQLVSSIP